MAPLQAVKVSIPIRPATRAAIITLRCEGYGWTQISKKVANCSPANVKLFVERVIERSGSDPTKLSLHHLLHYLDDEDEPARLVRRRSRGSEAADSQYDNEEEEDDAHASPAPSDHEDTPATPTLSLPLDTDNLPQGTLPSFVSAEDYHTAIQQVRIALGQCGFGITIGRISRKWPKAAFPEGITKPARTVTLRCARSRKHKTTSKGERKWTTRMTECPWRAKMRRETGGGWKVQGVFDQHNHRCNDKLNKKLQLPRARSDKPNEKIDTYTPPGTPPPVLQPRKLQAQPLPVQKKPHTPPVWQPGTGSIQQMPVFQNSPFVQQTLSYLQSSSVPRATMAPPTPFQLPQPPQTQCTPFPMTPSIVRNSTTQSVKQPQPQPTPTPTPEVQLKASTPGAALNDAIDASGFIDYGL